MRTFSDRCVDIAWGIYYDYEDETEKDVERTLQEAKSDGVFTHFYDLDVDDTVDMLREKYDITGSGCGSYTYSTAVAEINLVGNDWLWKEALSDYGFDTKTILELGPEVYDCICRDYVLPDCTKAVLERLCNDELYELGDRVGFDSAEYNRVDDIINKRFN